MLIRMRSLPNMECTVRERGLLGSSAYERTGLESVNKHTELRVRIWEMVC